MIVCVNFAICHVRIYPCLFSTQMHPFVVVSLPADDGNDSMLWVVVYFFGSVLFCMFIVNFQWHKFVCVCDWSDNIFRLFKW